MLFFGLVFRITNDSSSEMLSCIIHNTPAAEAERVKGKSKAKQPDPKRKATLIICPLSCVSQWYKEITTKSADGLL